MVEERNTPDTIVSQFNERLTALLQSVFFKGSLIFRIKQQQQKANGQK